MLETPIIVVLVLLAIVAVLWWVKARQGALILWRRAMAGLNDVIREASPDGNVAKSLTDALGALLGSNVLTGGGAGQTASTGSQPTTDAGGVLGGLGGLLNKLEQSGLGDQTKSWVGTGQKSAGLTWSTWLGAWPQYHQDTVSDDGRLRGSTHQTTVAGYTRDR